uniref:Uncharacterized protein n=1 Tax=Anguilla anguilla TaxID=7936 RepID=A0A0E9S1F9_ANGAN
MNILIYQMMNIWVYWACTMDRQTRGKKGWNN